MVCLPPEMKNTGAQNSLEGFSLFNGGKGVNVFGWKAARIHIFKWVLWVKLKASDGLEVSMTIYPPASSNINWIVLLISGDDVITNKDDSPFIASVYHALCVAARNIDNDDYT